MRIIDPFLGQTSIKNKEVSFLHANSVSDDPTRVIRAARYCARFSFNLSPSSIRQVKETLDIWPWVWSHQFKSNNIPPSLANRLRMELDLLFEYEPWAQAINLLEEWGGLSLLDPALRSKKGLLRRIFWAERLKINKLTVLISLSTSPIELAERLGLNHTEKILIKESIEVLEFLKVVNIKRKNASWTISKYCERIESYNWDPNSVALAICQGEKGWESLLRWWGKWRLTQSPFTASQLISKGWKEGPEIGKELKRLRNKELDNLKRIKN